MVQLFHKELEKLKKKIVSLGALVEERVDWTVKAVTRRDTTLADRIIHEDYEVDSMEVEVEEECLKILALHQPVAVDLRFIVAVIKINNDLERIADEAVNIAKCVKNINAASNVTYFFDYGPMGAKAASMLKLSLDALINQDMDLAFKVLLLDDDVDQIHRESWRAITAELKQHSENTEYLINLLLISRHLERIADHAHNVAEEIIYLTEGEIVRHGNY